MRLQRAVVAGALLASGLVAQGANTATAAPAMRAGSPETVGVAKKCDTKQVYWYTRYGHEVYVGTNLYSNWLEGPGRVTYSETATSESNSSWSGDLGVSIPLVIAEIQNKYSKTVGKSYSVSQAWSYTAEVPAGKIRRLHQLKQSWRVTVVRWRYTTSDCKKTKELSAKVATFPTKNRDYMWILVGRE
jgi:hypothetical protein